MLSEAAAGRRKRKVDGHLTSQHMNGWDQSKSWLLSEAGMHWLPVMMGMGVSSRPNNECRHAPAGRSWPADGDLQACVTLAQWYSADVRCLPVALTSGVKMLRGTRVQKKPRETQCVANLRMPK